MSDNTSRLYLKSQGLYWTFSGNKHKCTLNGVNLAKLTGLFFIMLAVIPRDILKLNPVYSTQTAWTLLQFCSEPEAHSMRKKMSVDKKEKSTAHLL